MAAHQRKAQRLVAVRNLIAAMAALLGALLGIAQALQAPTPVKLILATGVAIGALVVVVLHVIERRDAANEAALPHGDRIAPRTLPPRPMRFVNREQELAELTEVMRSAEASGRALVAVLSGLPGVGKSAVSAEWAHHVRARFGDGSLCADFSERRRGAAVDVSGTLGKFIRELGTADVAIPANLPDRAELYRSLTADRRLLVLLDDVSEAAQVQQLRPLGAGSVTLVTAYRPLEELHYEGAALVAVNPLPDDRAVLLLVEMAGEAGPQLELDREHTCRLVGLCGGLPLPLCVCAARLLIGQGARTVSSIVKEIEDENQRLRVLSGKGEYAGAAVFGFAYGDLEPAERLVYRRLALHPGLDVDATHAALLAGVALAAAQARLEALADTHLLQPLQDGRYRFHDLVRLHARERAEDEESEGVRESAVRRLVDWYCASLRSADRTIVPERLRLAPDEDIKAEHVPEFDSREAAFGWLERERANIGAVLHAVHDREWDERGWEMAEALWPFFHNRRHYADWIDACELGVACARRAGNREAAARVGIQLARAFIDLGDFERAHIELERCERTGSASTDMRLQASIQECVGICYLSETDHERALQTFREAREMFESFGDTRGMAIQDYFIGRALTAQGAYGEAQGALEQALARMQAIDDRLFVGRILLRRGQAIRRAGDLEAAEVVLREAIAVLAPLAMHLEEAESYEELAAIAQARGDSHAAAEHRGHAQDIYRAIGHPRAVLTAISSARTAVTG
jgi:tetratricopeptide (TPR) repeat protein